MVMRRSDFFFLLLFFAVVIGPDSCKADFILSPVSGSASGFSSNIYPVGNTINRSGLSTSFTSGVTNFDAYALTNPTHSNLNINTNHYFGGSPPFGVIDYDLGAEYSISRLALWGATFSASVRDFDLIASVNSDFSGSTTLGSFTAAQNSNLQQFTFSSTTARYIRLDAINNHGGGSDTAIGEIAFRATSVAAVPEPATFTLLGMGAVSMLAFRRRRLQLPV